jgi:hypothetical protein
VFKPRIGKVIIIMPSRSNDALFRTLTATAADGIIVIDERGLIGSITPPAKGCSATPRTR